MHPCGPDFLRALVYSSRLLEVFVMCDLVCGPTDIGHSSSKDSIFEKSVRAYFSVKNSKSISSNYDAVH